MNKGSNPAQYPSARLRAMKELMAFAQQAGWRPARIDVALLKQLGIAKGKERETIYALGFLGLIDNENLPTSEFDKLKQNYQSTLRRLVQVNYAELFSLIPLRLIDQARIINFFGAPIELAEYVSDTIE